MELTSRAEKPNKSVAESLRLSINLLFGSSMLSSVNENNYPHIQAALARGLPQGNPRIAKRQPARSLCPVSKFSCRLQAVQKIPHLKKYSSKIPPLKKYPLYRNSGCGSRWTASCTSTSSTVIPCSDLILVTSWLCSKSPLCRKSPQFVAKAQLLFLQLQHTFRGLKPYLYPLGSLNLELPLSSPIVKANL